MSNPVIIAGKLDDKELRDSIDKLVKEIDDKFSKAAVSFTDNLQLMQLYLNSFRTEATQTAHDIKAAFSAMGTTFDNFAKAMEKAASAAQGMGGRGGGGRGGSGGGAGGAQYGANTLGELEQRIAAEKQKSKELDLQSQQLRDQINLIRALEKQLKQVTQSTRDQYRERTKIDLAWAKKLGDSSEQEIMRKIRELEIARQNMGRYVGLFNKAEIQGVTKEIDKLTKKLDNLRAKASQQMPTTMGGVLGMSESTLNDITRKMQAIRQLQGTLNVQTQSIEMNRLNAEYARLSKAQSDILGKNERLIKSNSALARAFKYIQNRLAFMFTVGAATNFVKQLYEIRSQYELLERSLGVLVQSFEKGRQIFSELSEMALKSPFTLVELGTAAKQLTAYNFSAKEVVDTTRRLADISAALGVPMERLTYNLGQIRAQTVLTARDARDFANAGLPIVKSLSDYYTELEGKVVSTGDVYSRMSKKLVSFNDVMAVLNKMTDEGGRFFDFQAKQADTLRVQLANLTLAWNNMLNEIGESNQGLLAAPVKVLKSIFLAWKDINEILTSVIITLGIFKGAQLLANLALGKGTMELVKNAAAQQNANWQTYKNALATQNLTTKQAKFLLLLDSTNLSLGAALVRMKLLTAEEVRQIMSLNGWSKAWKILKVTGTMAFDGLITGIRSLTAALIASWPFLLLTGVVDAFMHLNQVAENNRELNKSIAEGAKEAASAMEDFMKVYSKYRGESGKSAIGALNESEAQKVWEKLKEQIENSSAAGDVFISKLEGIGDINERVSKGFEYADDILAATNALSGLENELKVVQDSIFWGAFGEGLAENLEDFTEAAEEYNKVAKEAKENGNGLAVVNMQLADATSLAKGQYSVASKQIEQFAEDAAEVIRDRLGEEGITSATQLTEAIARIVKEVEQANPKIRGLGKLAFEVKLGELFKEEFSGALTENELLWKNFLYRLKHDSSAAFGELTHDIITETGKWSPEQRKAIQDAADKIRNDLPSSLRGALDEMMRYIDSTDFRIRVSYDFGIKEYTKFQEDFIEKVDKKYGLTRSTGIKKYGPTEKQDLPTWVDEQQKAIAKNNEDIKKYERDRSDFSQKRLNDLKAENDLRKQALDVYNQQYEKEKKGGRGRGGAKKDPLGDALQEEIKLIGSVQKLYKDYLKMGVDAQTAMTKATSDYNVSLERQASILSKFGIQGKSAQQLATMDARSLRDYYETVLNVAKAKGTTKGIETLEKAIASLNEEITKTDYKKITDGLNNELNKLKGDYELSVELDANPELGDMFTDMFKINTDVLPKTFAEMYDKANDIAIKKMKELKADTSGFDLMSTAIVSDETGMWRGLAFDSEAVKQLLNWQKTFREMFKKNLLATEKDLDDYVKKYGTYADKIMEIESNRLAKIKELNNAYKEEMRNTAEYIAKLDAINQGAQKEKSKVNFEEFKNSQFYVTMFENLDYVSTTTIKKILERLRSLRDGMDDLEPDQLKTIVQQIEKLEDKLADRNPYNFGNLAKSAKEFLKALKDRKRVEKELQQFQDIYDNEMQELADLQEQLAQAKARGDEKAVKSLQEQIVIQKEAVKKSKEVLDNAQKAADRIKDAIKKFGKALQGTANMLSKWGTDIPSIRDKLADVGIDFGEGINMAIDGFAQATQGFQEVVQSATSGDISGMLVGVTDLVIGPFKMLQGIFGGFKKDYFTPLKESLEPLLDTLQKVSDYQLELLGNMVGTSAVKKYRELIANNNKIIDSYRDLADAAGRSNSSWTTHSYAYRTNKRLADDWKDISRYAGVTVRKVEDLYKLSPQQLKDVMMGAPAAWSNIEKDIREQLEKIIEYGDKEIEFAEKLGEALTAITFDNVNDDFENMLRDWDSSAEDFADNFEEYLRNAIVRAMMVNTYSDRLEQWYEHFKAAVGDEDKLTSAEASALRTEYMAIVNDALAERNAAMSILGGSAGKKELSALQQGIQGITEETANALEAYMNGVSQQVYLHSDLLVQIRDAIVGFDVDVQTATISQILLQLQSSYQVQMAIQNTLNGWSNANGMAVRVEMV